MRSDCGLNPSTIGMVLGTRRTVVAAHKRPRDTATGAGRTAGEQRRTEAPAGIIPTSARRVVASVKDRPHLELPTQIAGVAKPHASGFMDENAWPKTLAARMTGCTTCLTSEAMPCNCKLPAVRRDASRPANLLATSAY